MTKEPLQFSIKVITDETSENKAVFTLAPFPPGLGTTIGNSIRRTLFRFSEGYAISNIKFYPLVAHEFATIDGVVEDLQEIILRFKQVRLKKVKEESEEKVLVSLAGKTSFKAGEIAEASSTYAVLNPDLVIFQMNGKVKLDVELTITKGTGYALAEENKPEEQEIGSFPIDSIYAPILNVKMNVDNTLVGKRTDYEKVILDVETDGSLNPKDALKNVASMLRDIFDSISEGRIEKSEEQSALKAVEMNRERINTLLETPLSELNLSARVFNSLDANGFKSLKDILGKRVNDLLLLPNFGKKCLQDLENFLKKEGLTLEMNIDGKEKKE